MNAFTRAVLNHLLQDREMPETVMQWVRAERDPVERAVHFAEELDRDFKAVAAAMCDPLLKEWLVVAVQHTNWRRVADRLLSKFGPWAPKSVPLPSRN